MDYSVQTTSLDTGRVQCTCTRLACYFACLAVIISSGVHAQISRLLIQFFPSINAQRLRVNMHAKEQADSIVMTFIV